mmetsp:Transcript_25148/g.58416  ORF Transcript_25148/g.58416 Transcript_25148/m.58416 type:complete len:110 (-) Transcript_25148:209-538(-)
MTDRYFFRCEGLGLAVTDVHLDVGLVVFGYNVVRKELFVCLHGLVAEIAPNKPLDIEDRLLWIRGGLILSSIPDEPFTMRVPGDVRWCDAVALFIGYDLDASILKHANA